MIKKLLKIMTLLKDKDSVVLVLFNDELLDVFEEFGEAIADFCGINELTIRDELPKEVSKVVNVDYTVLDALYAKDAPKIFGRLSITSSESVKKNIENGVLRLTLEGKKYELPSNAFSFEWDGLPGQVIKEFEEGVLIINSKK